MNQRTWVTAAAAALSYTGLGVGCNSSSGGSAPPATCTPADGSVTRLLSIDAGPPACQACIDQTCSTSVEACSQDCTCNSSALNAIDCIESLQGSASVSSIASCVQDLTTASDSKLVQVGECLSSCSPSCSASPSDAGCSNVDATVTAYLNEDSGACASCLQTQCGASVNRCTADCRCDATVVTALQCLAGLAGGASIAGTTACVSPVVGAVADPTVLSVGSCLASVCSAQCGLSTMTPEAGLDAGPISPDAGDSGLGPTACPPLAAVTTLASGGYPASVVSDGTNVYWTNFYGTGSIQSIPRDGGSPTTVAASRNGPWGLALDSTNMYWTEDNGGNGHGQVLMGLKTGASSPVVIASNQASPRGIVFDGTNLYWTTVSVASAGGGVWTATPSAGATVTMIGAAQAMPLGIALDSHKAVYWQSYGTGQNDGIIGKWDPSTSTASTLATGQSGQYGIALSPDGGNVYWTNYDQANVLFMSTTPSAPPPTPMTLANDPGNHPRGIFVDAPNPSTPEALVVYWTDFNGPGTVWYSKSGVKCAIATNEQVPQGIWVDDKYVYWVNFVGSGALRRALKIQ